MASKAGQPTWPFELCDEAAEQIRVLQGWVNPFQQLQIWIHENVRALTGEGEMYADRLRVEYRLDVQSEIMRMVQEGKLDKELNFIHRESRQTEEAVHVSD
jgi:hypothetical protein